MIHPDFSVIIPTLNRPADLEECLRALCSQTYPRESYEIIVVDDGGSVPLEERLAKFERDADLRMLRQPGQGPAAARNAGAAVSRGRYLAFTDDDCVPEAGWLAALEKELRKDRRRLVGGRVVNALPENPYSTTSQIIVDFVQTYYRSAAGHPRFFATNNIAVHADAFRKVDGFSAAFRTSEDRDFCDRWLAAGYGMVHAPDAVVRHAHRLNFASFWKQHMGYGRGAWRFYRAYGTRHGCKSSIEPGFYAKLVSRLPDLILQQPRNRAFLCFLMIVWQLANLAGFVSAALSSDDGIREGSGKL